MRKAFSYIEIIIATGIFIIMIAASMNVFMILSKDMNIEESRVTNKIKFEEMTRYLRGELRNKSESYSISNYGIQTNKIQEPNSSVRKLEIVFLGSEIVVKNKNFSGGLLSTNKLMTNVRSCRFKILGGEVFVDVEMKSGESYEDVL